jgi:hypothetical protein
VASNVVDSWSSRYKRLPSLTIDIHHFTRCRYVQYAWLQRLLACSDLYHPAQNVPQRMFCDDSSFLLCHNCGRSLIFGRDTRVASNEYQGLEYGLQSHSLAPTFNKTKGSDIFRRLLGAINVECNILIGLPIVQYICEVLRGGGSQA